MVVNSIFISLIKGPESSPYPLGLSYATIFMNTCSLKVGISKMYTLLY